MNTNTLYQLCNKNDWFTSGTNDQYDKLFALAAADAPLEDLALAIWLCSENVTRSEVLAALKNAQ